MKDVPEIDNFMHIMLRTITRQISLPFRQHRIWQWMKITVTLVAGCLLYREVFVKNDPKVLWSAFCMSWQTSSAIFFLTALLLVHLNWSLEAVKWKVLVRHYHPIDFKAALGSIMVGLTFGVITPSRIGEYGGRFYMMPESDRWKTISSTFVSSMAQNIVTAVTGLLGTVFLISWSQQVNPYLTSSLLYLSALAGMAGLLVYFRIGVLQNMVRIIPSRRLARKLYRHSQYLKNIKSKTLHHILSLSFSRYLIYTTQYLLLLHFYGIYVPIPEAIAMVSMIFLVQSGLPLPPVLGMLARGEIAVIFWSFYTGNTLGILATTFTLWGINLIIPALFGLGIVLKK